MAVGDVHIVGPNGNALCEASGPLRGYNATSQPCHNCANWPELPPVLSERACVPKQASDPVRIVGIMLAKDEADAVPYVLPPLIAALDALYYFAGDAETDKAIREASPTDWAQAVSMPNVPHADGLRHYLLQAARADKIVEHDDRPMWVMPVQGDEIYHDDLRAYVLKAHAEKAEVMACQVATFLLHESQREGWDWTQPLATRLQYYIWDYGEHAGFLDKPEIYYVPTDHMRAHPHGLLGYNEAYAQARPVRKHYPFRSPEQARARLADRLRKTENHPEGWQPRYQNYESVFLSDEASGRPIKKLSPHYFPEAERVGGW